MIMRKRILSVIVLSCAVSIASVRMQDEPFSMSHAGPLQVVGLALTMVVLSPLLWLSSEIEEHRSSPVTNGAARAVPATPSVNNSNYIHGPGYVQSN
jgi:hypothetical protein